MLGASDLNPTSVTNKIMVPQIDGDIIKFDKSNGGNMQVKYFEFPSPKLQKLTIFVVEDGVQRERLEPSSSNRGRFAGSVLLGNRVDKNCGYKA